MTPARTSEPDKWADTERLTEFQREANRQAACIAAREVRGRAVHCPRHRASLEAWQRGDRPWPWPDPTPEEQARADDAMRDACEAYLAMVDGGLRAWTRTERRSGGRVL